MKFDVVQECLLKTIDSLEFAASDLREANRQATALESLLILDVIREVVAAKSRVLAIQSARNATEVTA